MSWKETLFLYGGEISSLRDFLELGGTMMWVIALASFVLWALLLEGRRLDAIRALIQVMPLLGLLGTVVGMMEVFDVLAQTGSSNARAMASGVAKATLPTMAGMVVTLSGLYFATRLERDRLERSHLERSHQ